MSLLRILHSRRFSFLRVKTKNPSTEAGFGVVQKKLRSGYPAKGEVSGRRAREVMPEAIRAESAKRVAMKACIRT